MAESEVKSAEPELRKLASQSGAANTMPSTAQTKEIAQPVTISPAADAMPLAPRDKLVFRGLRFFNTSIQQEGDHGLGFLLIPIFLGAGAGFYLESPREWPVLLLSALFGCALFAAIVTSQRTRVAYMIAKLALAFLAGALCGSLESRSGPALLDGVVTTHVTGRIEARETDEAGRTRYLIRLEGTADPVLKRPPGKVRLIARGRDNPLPVGAMIAGRARLSPPSGPAMPGGYDFARAAFADGIGAYGFFYGVPELKGSDTLASLPDHLSGRLNALRATISERARKLVPGDAGALIAALTVSDRRAISGRTVENLRISGLAHILAISGLHMALVGGTFFFAMRKIASLFPVLSERHAVKKLASLGAIAVATAYLGLSGAGIATQRAWLMMVILLGAVLFDRQALTMRNVALAAIVVLMISPFAVLSPGFQMSFAATAALIAAYDAWRRYGKDRDEGKRGKSNVFLRFLGGLALTSLVAGLATGLFAAYHFNRISTYGLLANVLAMPLVTFLVMPAGLLGLLLMPFGLDRWPLELMGFGLEGVMRVAAFVSNLGGAPVTGLLSPGATLLASAGLGALILLRSRLRLIGLAGLITGLVLMPVLSPQRPDIMISEDGRLVGLNSDEGLATNAARPSSFIFEQWQRGYRQDRHLPPLSAVRPDLPQDPGAQIAALTSQARKNPGRFVCESRQLCAAFIKERLLLALGTPDLIGPACDSGDIVVLAAWVRMRACRSGAQLLTARSLNETGAVAINLSGVGTAPQVSTALGVTIRPWTIQRYYDWRSDSFTLPDEAAARSILSEGDRARTWAVVQQDNVSHQNGPQGRAAEP